MIITAVLALHDQPKYWVTATYRSIFISDVHLGPRDVIDVGVTGVMHEDLWTATEQAIGLDRRAVWQGSDRWSWENA